jgi:tricorn protease
MTDWEGSDTSPMWHGATVYYLSDAGESHLLDIWAFDTVSGARRQVTRLGGHDVRWPAIGPGPDGGGEIVFQHGSELKLVDLPTGAVRTLDVTIPGDRPTLAPQTYDVAEAIERWSVSPTGQRVAVEARGDVWTVPRKHGAPRNLTASDGVADRVPAWSPDGRWVACSSDRSGEYELWLLPSDGKGEPRQLTRGSEAWYDSPTWSPDGERLAFTDQLGGLFVHVLDEERTVLVDRDPYASTGAISWSHDGTWLAYTRTGDNLLAALRLWDAEAERATQVTAGRFDDASPCFDREGEYLYLASMREWSGPRYDDFDSSFVYAATGRLMLVPLREDVPSPWLAKSDEEPIDDDDEHGDDQDEDDDEDGEDEDRDDEDEADGDSDDDGDDGDDEEDGDEADEENDDGDEADDDGDDKDDDERLVIDLEGFERRAILLPVDRGNFGSLAVTHDGKLVFLRRPADGEDGDASVRLFDVEDDEQEEQTLAEKADDFELSADGKLLLVVADGKATLREPKQGAEVEPVPTTGMRVTVDPRDEWRNVYADAWRRYREWFYDPQMHGVDWGAVRARYEPMLADCVSRRDLGYVIRELISELNVGHAYYRGADEEGELEPTVPVGLLGCDFALEQGSYRITRILSGAPWDADARGPLGEPGVDVEEGDWLLAVDGVPLDPGVDPWAPFVGKAGRVVALTVSGRPTLDDAAREVLVEPVADDGALRYRAWVERNRRRVEEATEGRVAYVHVPDTGRRGQDELHRQFFGQADKAAMIVDERWNAGGQVPTRFVELLDRPVTNYWAIRGSRPFPWPFDAHHGPKCMLINQRAGSGGDAFPYYFRQAGLGPLIGVRTWGGLVGIGGLPPMIDGAEVTVPNFAFYETDGTWGVEGHGVEPDIEVVDDPALMVDGTDPQLEKAIETMLAALEAGEAVPRLPIPPWPDRSGMGLPEEDR